eukprot:451729-Rhodomonas_salina.3
MVLPDLAHNAIVLSTCYAMPDTDLRYGAIRPRWASCSRELAARYRATGYRVWGCQTWAATAQVGSAICVCPRYAMPGTDLGSAGTRTRERAGGTIPSAGCRSCGLRYQHTRVLYAVSDIDIAYGGISLRACYAM